MLQFGESGRVVSVRSVSRRGAVGGSRSPGVVELSSGDPDLVTPEPIVRAAIDALVDDYTHYLPAAGLPALREKIAAQTAADYGISVDASEVLLTHGGSGGITSSILAAVDPGQAVVIPEPTYSLYADAVALAGGRLVPVPVVPGAESDGIAQVIQAVQREDAAMVILCNPANPTGGVYNRDALEALGEALQGSDCLVLADEAYKDICYSDNFTSTLAIGVLWERLIYCQTFSKSFAMTGWRLGYLIASEAFISSANLVHKTMTGPLNAAVQVAALKALEERQELVSNMVEVYKQRRELMLEELSTMPGVEVIVPEASFYVFVKYKLDIPAEEFRVLLEDQYGVAVRAGSEYGDSGEGYVRLSFAYSESTLRRGLHALRAAFTDLHHEKAVQVS